MPLTPEPTSPSPIPTQERGLHSRPAAARRLQGGARAKPPSGALVWPAPAPHRVAWALLPLRPAPTSGHPSPLGRCPHTSLARSGCPSVFSTLWCCPGPLVAISHDGDVVFISYFCLRGFLSSHKIKRVKSLRMLLSPLRRCKCSYSAVLGTYLPIIHLKSAFRVTRCSICMESRWPRGSGKVGGKRPGVKEGSQRVMRSYSHLQAAERDTSGAFALVVWASHKKKPFTH